MNAKFIVVQKCCFILLAWSVSEDNCRSHLALNCKDSEDCECKQMRHYDVVNFFKDFSQSYYYRRNGPAEKKEVCVSKWQTRKLANSTLFAMRQNITGVL